MIDVIVPVYLGHEQTRRCLDSVLANRDAGVIEVVVVDDASPEPALAAYLDTLSRNGSIALLKNETNRGFVESVNRGMSVHPDRDVVLLNSDTEVAAGWLERLAACAYREPDIGTVTPFSNNATICSYPFDGWTGGVPGTLGLPGLDRLIATTNAGRHIEIPTAVGFCMYIRRACLEAVGVFDVARFGRGYGEENDFCLRARAAGWRSVLAADTFVFHQGSVSFGGERNELQRIGLKRLLDAHPGFLDALGDFSHRDPVAPLRRAIDDARYALGGNERDEVLCEQGTRRVAPAGSSGAVQLHFTHSWDGGTNRWIADFCAHDAERRNLVLRSVSNRDFACWRLELLDPDALAAPLMHWDLERPISATDAWNLEYRLILDQIVATFDIRAIVVSSLVGHALEALDTGLPTVVVLHDLYPFCPAMFAAFGQPCSECDTAALERCMRGNPHNAFWHNTDTGFWLGFREAYAKRLDRPWIRFAAPSASAWDRWLQLFPAIASRTCKTIPHGLAPLERVAATGCTRKPEATRKLRLVVPGRLLPHKGLALFAEVVPRLLAHAEILLLGCGRFGDPFGDVEGITVVRHYAREDLARHVEGFMPDAALLLSVVPESFSYTLSEMLWLGLPVIATRIGAFSERIQEGLDGLLVAADADAVVAAVERLARDSELLSTLKQGARSRPARTVTQMVTDYHALLPLADRPLAGAANHAGQTRGALGLTIRAARERTRLEDDCRRQQVLLGEARECNQQLEAQLAAAQRRCAESDSRASKSEADCDAMRRSRSWRITAPLRLVTRALRRMFGSATAVAGGEGRNNERADLVRPNNDGRFVLSDDSDVRIAARVNLRERLAIPGRSRIVLGWSSSAGSAFAARFLHVAIAIGATRNDVFFVIRGDVGEIAPAEDRRLALLIVTRRLFVEPCDGAVSDTLLGADVVVLDAGDPLGRILKAEPSRSGPEVVVLAPASVEGDGGAAAMSHDIQQVSPGDADRVIGALLDHIGSEKA
ncbi:MAG: glycosyltransferase [Rhodocyclaceae bacterium]|nr:glycosyltransferase [Rhodocyclaceae bacterium]